MRLFNSRLLLWGAYTLIIPRISSIPVPGDLQIDPVYDEQTLVPREYSLGDSPYERSLEIRAPGQPPVADCGYELGKEVPSGVKGERKFIMYEGSETYASVRLKRHLGGGVQGSIWEAEHKYYQTRENERKRLPIMRPKMMAVKISPGGNGIDQGLLQEEIDSEFVMAFEALVWSRNTMESILVMPEGSGDLGKALRQGKNVNAALSIWSAGQALLAAHRKRIVHRDVKPDNIIFARNGKIYLIDWDLAIKLRGDYATSRAGQKNFKGPEAANKEEYNVFKDDVFALALTWLEAEQPRDMQDRTFRKRLYEWLTAPGDKKDKPSGHSYRRTSDHLKGMFGRALSSPKRHLMAKGLCRQSERFSLSEFMSEFSEVNRGSF